MKISAALVKELRDRTNAGFMECKRALQEAEGDIEKAVDVLRKRGIKLAEQKLGRQASEGVIASYIHLGGKIGVLVEVNCETDFVAKNEVFKEVVKNITMQIAAKNPMYLRREDVPADVIEKEKEIYRAQMKNKPEHIIDKIVNGKMNKFYSENCLMEQKYIRDDELTVENYIKQRISELGENIVIRRFTRYCVGETIKNR